MNITGDAVDRLARESGMWWRHCHSAPPTAGQTGPSRRGIPLRALDRHRDLRPSRGKLREELTLARIDRHSGQVDELDVEGILAFGERVLPRAADLWVQASLEQRQPSNNCFFQRESRSTETALLEPP